MPIDTVQDLRDHLQLAIQVEVATIPPYLYALYSIEDMATTSAEYLRSVATEEMLHATLMANILLALGGEPRFYSPEVLPAHPSPWPNKIPELILNLEPCTQDVVVTTFLGIEAPGRPEAPTQPDRYESQGQFYHALEQAIVRLADEVDIFSDPQTDRQLHDPSGYLVVKYDDDMSGGLVVINSVETALAATEIAIHQGEGLHEARYADPDHRELTHYSKFLSLTDGTVDIGSVIPLVKNPSIAAMPRDVAAVAEFSNAIYSYLFVILDRLLARDRQDRHQLVGILYGVMVGLLGPVSRYLTTRPAGDGEFWGPPFEYYHFSAPDDAEDEVRRLGLSLATEHPAIVPALRHLNRL